MGKEKEKNRVTTVIVIVCIMVATCISVFCCCKMLTFTSGEMVETPVKEEAKAIEPVEETIEVEVAETPAEPEEPVEEAPLILLYRCNVCGLDKETTHEVMLDGVHVADICTECADELMALIVHRGTDDRDL